MVPSVLSYRFNSSVRFSSWHFWNIFSIVIQMLSKNFFKKTLFGKIHHGPTIIPLRPLPSTLLHFYPLHPRGIIWTRNIIIVRLHMSEKLSNGKYKQHDYPLIFAMMDIKQALKITVWSRISRNYHHPVMYSTLCINSEKVLLTKSIRSYWGNGSLALKVLWITETHKVAQLCMYLECWKDCFRARVGLNGTQYGIVLHVIELKSLTYLLVI